jgi:hypothetical protein
MTARLTLTATAVMLCVVIGGTSGCLHGESENWRTATANEINDAFATIQAESSRWQQALADLQGRIPEEAQEWVRIELTNLATRSLQAATEQFRCQVDFLGSRVSAGLIRLRALVLREEVPSRPSVFCDVTPASVDMSVEPERRSKLDLSGYDFDQIPPLEVWLVRSADTLNVSQHLSRQTHYHMTLNLAGNGVPLDRSSQRLVFRQGDRDISFVPILQPKPRPCAVQPYAVPPSSRTYMPPHTGRGDKEFFGQVDITVRVGLEPHPSHLDVRLEMHAEQRTDDHSTASGGETYRLYTAPEGLTISQVTTSPLSDELSYYDTDWEDDSFDRGPGGPVHRFVIRGDHSGPDAGEWAQVTAKLNPITLVLTKTKDCEA